MMYCLRGFLALTLISITSSHAEEEKRPPADLYFEELVSAYNFVTVQEEALKVVAKQHPELQDQIDTLRAEQKASSLGTAIAALKSELKERLGDTWEESEKTLRTQILENDLRKEFTTETANTMVTQYGKVKDGLVPSDILRILISLHPSYIETPTKELKDGWIQPFEKKRGDKTFSILLPGSWKPRDMKNPNNLVGVVHKAGHGICTISLTAIPVAPQLYEQQYAKHSPVELAKLLIPKAAKIVSSEEAQFAGTTGGFSVYDIADSGPPVARIIQYAAYQGDFFVLLQLSIALKENHDLDYLTKKFKPVLIQCAQSLKVQ